MKTITLKDNGIDELDCIISIDEEDERQLAKWGFQEHNIFEWLAYLTEEIGEVNRAVMEYVYRQGNKKDIEKEAIQVATLAIKIKQMVGRLK